jgi:hypothetical protein
MLRERHARHERKLRVGSKNEGFGPYVFRLCVFTWMATLLGRLKRFPQCGQAYLLPVSDCFSAAIGGRLSSRLRSPCDDASDPRLSFSEIVDKGDDGRGRDGAESTGWGGGVSCWCWKGESEGRFGSWETRGEVVAFKVLGSHSRMEWTVSGSDDKTAGVCFPLGLLPLVHRKYSLGPSKATAPPILLSQKTHLGHREPRVYRPVDRVGMRLSKLAFSAS